MELTGNTKLFNMKWAIKMWFKSKHLKILHFWNCSHLHCLNKRKSWPISSFMVSYDPFPHNFKENYGNKWPGTYSKFLICIWQLFTGTLKEVQVKKVIINRKKKATEGREEWRKARAYGPYQTWWTWVCMAAYWNKSLVFIDHVTADKRKA